MLLIAPIAVFYIVAICYCSLQYFESADAANGLAAYQNGKLGVSFEYPESWSKPIVVDDESCFKDSCSVSFNIAPNIANGQNYILGVRVNTLSGSEEDNTCSCDSLLEYVKWDYNNAYKDQAVLNDNQTIIRGNLSAWQMELLNNENGYKTWVTWVIYDNLGYRFLYSGANDNQFGIFTSDFKKLLASVKLVSPNTTSTSITQEGKTPSFLSTTNKSTQSESPTLVSKTPSFLSKSKNNNSQPNTGTQSSAYTAPLINEDSILPLQTYSYDDFGISMTYPSDWTLDKDTSEHYTIAHLVSPDDEATVDIRIFPKGSYKSLRDYGNKEFKESDDITLLQYYRNSTTILGGKPALKAIYLTTTSPGLFGNALGYVSSTSKAMMVATDVPEKKSIVAIAYFTDSNNFDKYLSTVNQILSSFQMGNKSPVIHEED